MCFVEQFLHQCILLIFKIPVVSRIVYPVLNITVCAAADFSFSPFIPPSVNLVRYLCFFIFYGVSLWHLPILSFCLFLTNFVISFLLLLLLLFANYNFFNNSGLLSLSVAVLDIIQNCPGDGPLGMSVGHYLDCGRVSGPAHCEHHSLGWDP